MVIRRKSKQKRNRSPKRRTSRSKVASKRTSRRKKTSRRKSKKKTSRKRKSLRKKSIKGGALAQALTTLGVGAAAALGTCALGYVTYIGAGGNLFCVESPKPNDTDSDEQQEEGPVIKPR